MYANRDAEHDGPISVDTVSSLRHRLHAMKEIFGDGDNDGSNGRRRGGGGGDGTSPLTSSSSSAQRRRRAKNCMDTFIDGSLMGVILAVCLCMVLGAAFFAYKNLYFAVMKKIYPDRSGL